MRKQKYAFTLVELLVVIGIIALLIAILLPSLAKAQQSSRVVSCLSNLRQISIAATNFAAEHRGHYPLAGYVNDGTPTGVGDPSQLFYSYFTDKTFATPTLIAPLPEALAPYLGFPVNNDTKAHVKQDLADPTGVQRIFSCVDDSNFLNHSGQTAVTDPTNPALYNYQSEVYSSYVFNGAALGLSQGTVPRYQGNLVEMHDLGNIMFMADGLNRGTKITGLPKAYSQDNSFEMDNLVGSRAVGPPVSTRTSMANAYAFDVASCGVMFDVTRHTRRMNVVFMDGHGETLALPTVAPNFGNVAGGAGTALSYIGSNGFNQLDWVKLSN